MATTQKSPATTAVYIEEENMRKSFADILKNTQFNIETEYYRLKKLFYEKHILYHPGGIPTSSTLYNIVNARFTNVSFRNNALSLEDFDHINEFNFNEYKANVDIDLFLTFCEYLINIITDIKDSLPEAFFSTCELIQEQIGTAIERMEFMEIYQGNLISYVPKNTSAITVAEIIDDDDSSYKILFYNHHSLSGDIEGKKEILLKLANLFESRKSEAKGVCDKVSENLRFAFNNFNIRHNNIDPSSKSYQEFFAKLSDSEKEELYDDTYQLCLEFFITLDNKDKIKKFEDIRRK